MQDIVNPTKRQYWPSARVTLEERRALEELARALRLNYSDLTRAALALLQQEAKKNRAPYGIGGGGAGFTSRGGAASYPQYTPPQGESQAMLNNLTTRRAA